MGRLAISIFAARRAPAVVLRYGLAVVSAAVALATALILRHYDLPHPFTSFSMAAVALTFWYAGTGPGLLGLLSFLAMGRFFIRFEIFPGGPSPESYLIVYGIFGLLVSWFSASRHRAERLVTEARENLEVRVAERTSELKQSNDDLQSTQAELRSEKDRLKLLLDLNNAIVSNLELRDLLRVISGSVRQVMQCDSVGVNLPDPETGELRLYALDFPGTKGFLREELLRPTDSLP